MTSQSLFSKQPFDMLPVTQQFISPTHVPAPQNNWHIPANVKIMSPRREIVHKVNTSSSTYATNPITQVYEAETLFKRVSSLSLTEEVPLWEFRPTCYMSLNKQTGKIWQANRIGRVTGSTISDLIEDSKANYASPPDETARIICGLSDKTFTVEGLCRTEIGIKGESVLRKWYADSTGYHVDEVGLAVFKEDERFGGSLDGEIDFNKAENRAWQIAMFEEKVRPLPLPLPRHPEYREVDEIVKELRAGIEIKLPKFLYKPLIQHFEAMKRGYTPPAHDHSHIFNSHYNQMVMGMKIVNLKWIDYIVGNGLTINADTDTTQVYCERFYPNEDHWSKIYTQACIAYDRYITPLLKHHNIKLTKPVAAP